MVHKIFLLQIFLLTFNNDNAIMLARATELLKSFVALFYSAEFKKTNERRNHYEYDTYEQL